MSGRLKHRPVTAKGPATKASNGRKMLESVSAVALVPFWD